MTAATAQTTSSTGVPTTSPAQVDTGISLPKMDELLATNDTIEIAGAKINYICSDANSEQIAAVTDTLRSCCGPFAGDLNFQVAMTTRQLASYNLCRKAGLEEGTVAKIQNADSGSNQTAGATVA